jgi:hypothetical protein
MDKELEEKLLAELEQSGDPEIKIKNLYSANSIENEINNLMEINKKVGWKTIMFLIIAIVSVFLLMLTIFFDFNLPGFFKGFLTGACLASLPWLIPAIYRGRIVYDKELFILNLLKDSKTKNS